MDIAFSWPTGPDDRTIALLREADTGINSVRLEERNNDNWSGITKKILNLIFFLSKIMTKIHVYM